MSSISAGTTTTTGYVVTSDTTGALVLKTGASGTTAVTIDTSQNVTFAAGQTFSAGTANGVTYLNGSKVLTSGSALVFDGTNLGVGVTPSAWIGKALQIGLYSGFGIDGNGNAQMANNAYNDTSSSYRYVASSLGAGLYRQAFGSHVWFNAPSGTAGNAITFTQAMTLTAGGDLGVGITSPSAKLQVNGTGRFDSIVSIGGAPNLGYNSNLLLQIGQDASAVSGLMIRGVDGYLSFDAGAAALGFGRVAYNNSSNYMTFFTSATERARIDSSGNLIVGGTSASAASATTLYNDGTIVSVLGNGVGGSSLFGAISGVSNGYEIAVTSGNAQTYKWYNGGTQSMTLDSSSNLFVGWTPTGSGEAKFAVRSSSTYAMWVSNGFATSTPYGLEFGLQPGHGSYRSAIRGAPSNYGGDDNGMLLFYTSNSYNTGSLPERARITASGDLLIGQTGFASGAGISLRGDSSSAYKGSIWSGVAQSTNSYTSYELYSTNASAYRFYVGLGGTIYATNTTISAISDIRFKENIRDLDAGLAEVMALKPRLYDWKEGKGADIKNARGFIAQEFEEVFPDLIDEWKDPAPEGEEPYKSVRQDLVPVLVKAIQEQQAIITTLTERITALEAK